MDSKTLAFIGADLLMIVAAFVYGRKLLARRNYLLGLEWLIVGLSGTNFLLYSFIGAPELYSISFFFDAFSRAFGFPVIATVGLMAASHRYRPSLLADSLLFALSFGGAFVLVRVDQLAPIRPYFYLAMWSLYSLFLAYFAWRLWSVDERTHAVLLVAIATCGQVIASIYDFYKIPGDDAEHTLFYVAALSTWGLSLIETYYAYCALERSREHRSPARSATAPRGAVRHRVG